jgi:uncharacterized protein (DUF305 family)
MYRCVINAVHAKMKFLCVLLLIGGIATSNSSSSTAANTSTTTILQMLSNYSCELQTEWQYTWEDCDTDINFIQSLITIDSHHLQSDC